MSNRLLSTQDLADRLGIPSHTLSQWRRQGKGPCFIHIGSMIRYPVYEVELFERQFKSRSDWVVALDYYLLPRLDFGLPRIQLADRNGVEFESFRFDSLDYLYGMARRFRIRRSA